MVGRRQKRRHGSRSVTLSVRHSAAYDVTEGFGLRLPGTRGHRVCQGDLVTLPSVMAQAKREVVLTTSRVVLTSWLIEDVEPLFEIHSDPESMRFVRRGRAESLAEVEDLVRQYIKDHASRGWTKWRLADRQGGLIGRAGFGGDESTRGLSYHIRRDCWGQGLATEIALALVDWHRANAPAATLRALVEIGNDASVRVLQKVDFQEVGPEDYHGIRCRSFAYSMFE